MSVETLIAVPQAKELEPLLAAFTAAAGYRPRRATFRRLEGYLFEEFRLLFAVGGHGKTQFAVQTQHLIEQNAASEVVICTGAAGSLGGGPVLGDVIVGTSTIEHDYKLRFVQRPLPCYPADAQLSPSFGQWRARSPVGSRCFSAPSRAAMRTSSPPSALSKSGRQPGLSASPGKVQAPPERHASADCNSWRCESSLMALTTLRQPTSRRTSSALCQILPICYWAGVSLGGKAAPRGGFGV